MSDVRDHLPGTPRRGTHRRVTARTIGGVRSVELGQFLRSRRERAQPNAVEAMARRRSPGLRREELAQRAGIAQSWLVKLEQGAARSVSPSVLAALSRSLELDLAERRHLFALAGHHDITSLPESEVTASLRVLLDQLEPNPAYVLNRVWDIVAWNRAESWLFSELDSLASPANLLELVFADSQLARLMVDHHEEQIRLVAQFRAHIVGWPDDPPIAILVDRLRTLSSRFTELWDRHDVSQFATTTRHFEHPTAGHLVFDHHRLAVLDQPGLQLVVYTPHGSTPTI